MTHSIIFKRKSNGEPSMWWWRLTQQRGLLLGCSCGESHGSAWGTSVIHHKSNGVYFSPSVNANNKVHVLIPALLMLFNLSLFFHSNVYQLAGINFSAMCNIFLWYYRNTFKMFFTNPFISCKGRKRIEKSANQVFPD